MVKFSSFLMSSAIFVSLHSPLVAMESDPSDHSSIPSSSFVAAQPSWIYMEGENADMIGSFLSANLAIYGTDEELKDQDKKAITQIGSMSARSQFDFIEELERFFETSENKNLKDTMKNTVQSMAENLLNHSSDYKKTVVYSEQVRLLGFLSHPRYSIEFQVFAFEKMQDLIKEAEQQDLEKRTAWRDKMLQDIVKKDGALLLVGEAYQSLPNVLRAVDSNNVDILKALRGQEKLKDFSAIELLGSFLQIRDGTWAKDE